MEQYDFTTQPSILIQGAMESETEYMIGQLEDADCVTLGIYKYEKLGIDYPLKDVNPPTAERIENAKKILSKKVF